MLNFFFFCHRKENQNKTKKKSVFFNTTLQQSKEQSNCPCGMAYCCSCVLFVRLKCAMLSFFWPILWMDGWMCCWCASVSHLWWFKVFDFSCFLARCWKQRLGVWLVGLGGLKCCWCLERMWTQLVRAATNEIPIPMIYLYKKKAATSATAQRQHKLQDTKWTTSTRDNDRQQTPARWRLSQRTLYTAIKYCNKHSLSFRATCQTSGTKPKTIQRHNNTYKRLGSFWIFCVVLKNTDCFV